MKLSRLFSVCILFFAGSIKCTAEYKEFLVRGPQSIAIPSNGTPIFFPTGHIIRGKRVSPECYQATLDGIVIPFCKRPDLLPLPVEAVLQHGCFETYVFPFSFRSGRFKLPSKACPLLILSQLSALDYRAELKCDTAQLERLPQPPPGTWTYGPMNVPAGDIDVLFQLPATEAKTELSGSLHLTLGRSQDPYAQKTTLVTFYSHPGVARKYFPESGMIDCVQK